MAEWRYAEQILYVDLSAGAAWVEPTPLELKRRYVGGAGFVAGLLAREERPGSVVMATGPLSDEMAGRLALGAGPAGPGPARVPLSSLGGRMAASLKHVGYDALVLRGTLPGPGLLLLDHGDVRLLPAGDLRGADVPATEAAVTRLAGPEFASIALGPAAENGVAFATLAHEGHFAGGSGVAAALGATGLKAVAVRAPADVPSRCTGCTLACPAKQAPGASRAGELGLDAPTAARLAALARSCAEAGLMPAPQDPLSEIAHRIGVGNLLAEGEAAAVRWLGPGAEQIAAGLPRPKGRRGPGVADLLGTCQRLLRERPGQVLREALSATLGELVSA